MPINKTLRDKYSVKGFQFPVAPYVAQMKETDKFLKTEKKAMDAINKATDEFITLYKVKNLYQDKFKQAMPEVLRGILESYQSEISEVAVISYLERRGFEIKEPAE